MMNIKNTNRITGIHLNGQPGRYLIPLVFIVMLTLSAGCIGTLKIVNETDKKPAMSTEERAALLQRILDESQKEDQGQQAAAQSETALIQQMQQVLAQSAGSTQGEPAAQTAASLRQLQQIEQILEQSKGTVEGEEGSENVLFHQIRTKIAEDVQRGLVQRSTANPPEPSGTPPVSPRSGTTTPVTTAAQEPMDESRAALIQEIRKILDEYERTGQLRAGPAVTQKISVEPVAVQQIQKDALTLRQHYTYGDREHEMHAMVSDITLLPFYFWWFIDYNKFVVEQPQEGKQFLVVFLRFENHGTKSALVPSAELLPVMYNDTIYLHRPYFNLSALSEYQKKIYGGTNENIRLPYQWIRELGQDQRDYAFLSGYNAIDSGSSTTDNSTASSSTSANTSAFSSVTRCTGSITIPADSGKIISKDISSGQCPGFFIKPGESNAIDGYLIYEVPQDINLKQTYVYGLFNTYSWTRWRLG